MGHPQIPPQRPAPLADLRLVVRCTYCHDGLDAAPVYCASCLAPHHDGCFSEHGRCCAPGCGQVRRVRPSGPTGRRARWKLALVPLLAGVLVWAGWAKAQPPTPVPASRAPVSQAPARRKAPGAVPIPRRPSSPARRAIVLSVGVLTPQRIELGPGEHIVLGRDAEGFTSAVRVDANGEEPQCLLVVGPANTVWASLGRTRRQVSPGPNERILLSVVHGRLRVLRGVDPQRQSGADPG